MLKRNDHLFPPRFFALFCTHNHLVEKCLYITNAEMLAVIRKPSWQGSWMWVSETRSLLFVKHMDCEFPEEVEVPHIIKEEGALYRVLLAKVHLPNHQQTCSRHQEDKRKTQRESALRRISFSRLCLETRTNIVFLWNCNMDDACSVTIREKNLIVLCRSFIDNMFLRKKLSRKTALNW